MNATGTQLGLSQSALDGDLAGLIEVEAPGEAVDIEAEYTAARNRALLSVSAEAVRTIDADSLLAVQGLLQHGTSFGRWQTPRRWMPLAPKSLLNVDLLGRTVGFLPAGQQAALALDEQAKGDPSQQVQAENVSVFPLAATRAQRLVSEAVLTLVRYLVVCRMGPSGIGKKSKGRTLDASTLAAAAYQLLPQLMAIALSKRLEGLHDEPEDGGFFCRIAASDLERFSAGPRVHLEGEIKRMQMLNDRGLWDDVAYLDGDASHVTSVAGEAEAPPPEPKVDQHLPLPDDYVAEMGRKSLWLIRDLGPSLLQLTSRIREIWLTPDDQSVSPARIAQRRDEAVRQVLAEHAWLTPDGQPIEPPPFTLRHGAPRRFVWNPTVRIAGRRRARWACGQAAFEPVHMSTGRLSGARV